MITSLNVVKVYFNGHPEADVLKESVVQKKCNTIVRYSIKQSDSYCVFLEC